MEGISLQDITSKVTNVVDELIKVANLKANQIVIIGCSTSEIQGKRIGSASSMDIAKAVFDGIIPFIKSKNLFLAVQCCEHLNRALIVEEECVNKYGYETVTVLPHLHAGGAFATNAYNQFKSPVLVESISAHAGIDIGDIFIGMHLKRVAVPVRCEIKNIGEAHLTMARTRPLLIGGERAKYPVL